MPLQDALRTRVPPRKQIAALIDGKSRWNSFGLRWQGRQRVAKDCSASHHGRDDPVGRDFPDPHVSVVGDLEVPGAIDRQASGVDSGYPVRHPELCAGGCLDRSIHVSESIRSKTGNAQEWDEIALGVLSAHGGQAIPPERIP
jgi:hypothetical protein